MTRFARSTTSPLRSTITTTRATQRTCESRWLPSLRFLTGWARYEPAATIAGFASTPFAVVTYPELRTATAHLRTVLGDEDYESLARKGETMSTAEIAAYAYDQIDQARAELNAVSK